MSALDLRNGALMRLDDDWSHLFELQRPCTSASAFSACKSQASRRNRLQQRPDTHKCRGRDPTILQTSLQALRELPAVRAHA